MNRYVARTIRLIREDPARHRTIRSMSARLGCSESYLKKRFASEVGVSLGRYMREQRLSRAIELLVHAPELSLGEVAYEVGYHSTSALTKLFMRRLGLTPSMARAASSACTTVRRSPTPERHQIQTC